MLPYTINYVPYTAAHTVTQLQLLLFSGLAFFIMLPLMKRTLTISLDFDWFYRVAGIRLFDVLMKMIVALSGLSHVFCEKIYSLASRAGQLSLNSSVALYMTLVLLIFTSCLIYLLF